MDALVAILAFVLGVASDRIIVNKELDTQRCDNVKKQVDEIVGYFHERFSADPVERKSASKLFDYQIHSLVDDTTLLPIIGRKAFDGEYVALIGDIFAISKEDPEATSETRRRTLLESVESKAVDLKKVINANHGSWRLMSKG